MNKIGQVIIVVAVMIVVYLLMLVVMPFLTDIATTANVTMAASSNLSDYPGASEGLFSALWALWFAPAIIGMIAIVVILKKP